MRELWELRFRIMKLWNVLAKRYGNSEQVKQLVIQIASKKSPSSAFVHGQSIPLVLGISSVGDIALGKLTRWLSVVRRDYGQNAFKQIVTEVFGIQIQSSSQQVSSHSNSSSSSLSQVLQDSEFSLDSGIFLFGDYSVVGQYRTKFIKKLASQLSQDKNLIEKVHDLVPLEIFHACYLVNTEMVQNANTLLQKIVEPILKDEDLRRVTVMDDMISRILSAKFLVNLLDQLKNQLPQNIFEKLLEELNAVEKCEKVLSQFSQSEKDNIIARLTKISKQVKENLKDEIREIKNLKEFYAGEGHTLSYQELLSLPKIKVDLSKLLRTADEFTSLLRKKLEKFQYGIVSGVSLGRDLSKLVSIANVYPEEIFWYKYATNSLPQLELGVRKFQSFVIVLDKSGSMRDSNKTEWSRAVALALARFARKYGIKSYLVFFDEKPFEIRKLTSKEALNDILTIACDGGTKIDNALKAVDGLADRIILITDGFQFLFRIFFILRSGTAKRENGT